MLHDELYEQVINKGLDSELSVTDRISQTAPIDNAESSKVLAKYVTEVVKSYPRCRFILVSGNGKMYYSKAPVYLTYVK